MKTRLDEKSKNVKLFPKYRQISRDFLFFYTINILFLIQVKNISASNIVLIDTFYALFVVIAQIPASFIIDKIGRKKGMILGNTLNILYLILIMTSKNLYSLILAEIASSLAFSLKDIAEPAILNESIDLQKEEKSKKFARIQAKAISGYYLLSAISIAISGFLFGINPYIPMFLALIIVFVSLIMSTRFIEPNLSGKLNKKSHVMKEVSLKDSIKFAFKSKRCRCLLMFSAVFFSIFTVLATYEITLLEDLKIDSKYIGIIFAILNIIAAISSRKQNIFQKKLGNRTLTFLGYAIIISCIIAGAASIFASINIIFIMVIIISMYIIKYLTVGLYNVLIIKYLSNFTNAQIDTKIFAINSLVSSITAVCFGFVASRLLESLPIPIAMITFGMISFIIMSIVLFYMKNKVGLEPNMYSDFELKYDKKV